MSRPVPAIPDWAAALSRVPEPTGFVFAAAGSAREAAWIEGDDVVWVGGDGRCTPGGALPAGTHLELLPAGALGICRPTAAGVELLTVRPGAAPPAGARAVAAFATPRWYLFPRTAPAGGGRADTVQLLAVTGFDGTSALYHIDWAAGRSTLAGRLPLTVVGGVWVEPGRRLALNLLGPTGRSSVYLADLATERLSLLFESSPQADDRAMLYDPELDTLVVTCDAPGYPAVGVAQLRSGGGVRFFPALPTGDEAGMPCGFVDAAGTRQVVLLHDDGVCTRLRLADPATLAVSTPLPVPEGEVGLPVVVDGSTLHFPFSAPDRPTGRGCLDLATGRFAFRSCCPMPGDGDAGFTPALRWRASTFSGPAGAMPALVVQPAEKPAGDLTVVALHGGPVARWGGGWRGEVALLAGLGVPVIALDYPGSTGSGQALMRSLFGSAGHVDVAAVLGVIDELHREGRRVVLYGESYGAFLALLAAAHRPCAGVAALAPFGSFARLKETGSPKVREMLELLDGKNSTETGRNAIAACRTITAKVLIAHGTDDVTIPVAESRALLRALRGRKGTREEDARLVELPGEGHDLASPPALARWYLELARFVDGLQGSEIACPTRSPAAGALSRRPRKSSCERR